MKKLIWINDVGPDKIEVGAVAKTEDGCQKIVTGFLTLLNNSEQTARLLTMGILKGLNASESDLSELKRIFDTHIETIKNKGNETTNVQQMHPILAKFHEAKEAGFDWADDAIKSFDEKFASEYPSRNNHKELTYSEAIASGFWWVSSIGGLWHWAAIYQDLLKNNL